MQIYSCFLLKSFVVIALLFRQIIHFDLNFIHGVRWRVQLPFFLHADILVVSTPFVEKTFLFPLNCVDAYSL